MKKSLILASFLVLAVAIPLLAATMGYTTIGSNTGSYSPNLTIADGAFTMTENGTVTKIEIYTDLDYTGSNIIMGIYTDSAGAPNTTVSGCTTTPGTLDGSPDGSYQWRGQAPAGTCDLTNGTSYWIAFNKENSGESSVMDIKYDTGQTGHGKYVSHTYDGALSSPFGSASTLDQHFSIRVTYTPTGGGGGATSSLMMLGVGK